MMIVNRGIRTLVPAAAAVVLLLGACGSDDDPGAVQVTGAAAPTEEVAPTATKPPATEPPAPTAIPTGAAAEEATFTDQDAIDVAIMIGRAYDEYDEDLFLAVAAQDFHFIDERGTATRAQQVSYFPTLREGSQKGEALSDPVVLSREPFVVAVDSKVTANWYPPEGRTGTSTYTLVVEDGALKVLEHRWSGDPL